MTMPDKVIEATAEKVEAIVPKRPELWMVIRMTNKLTYQHVGFWKTESEATQIAVLYSHAWVVHIEAEQ